MEYDDGSMLSVIYYYIAGEMRVSTIKKTTNIGQYVCGIDITESRKAGKFLKEMYILNEDILGYAV